MIKLGYDKRKKVYRKSSWTELKEMFGRSKNAIQLHAMDKLKLTHGPVHRQWLSGLGGSDS